MFLMLFVELLAFPFRAAKESLLDWRPCLLALARAAAHDDSRVAFGNVWLETLTPLGWDTPPLAVSLRKAVAGSSTSLCASFVPSALRETIAEQQRVAQEKPGSPFKFQRDLPRRLFVKTYPDDIHVTILKRCRKHFSELAVGLSLAHTFELRAFAASFPLAVAFQCVRSWANAWTTSRRMEEISVHPALCGCFGYTDSQMHYFSCSRLWGAICLIDSFPLPSSPLHALCVLGSCPRAAVRVYVLATASHFLKSSFSGKVLEKFVSGDDLGLSRIWGDAFF